MEILIGILGALLALLAVFVLYLGATAVVFRFVALLRPEKSGTEREANTAVPAP